MAFALSPALILAGALAGAAPASPPLVIFDSDIAPDVDDAGATAILHALADLGYVRIAAMGACTSSPDGPACLDAINAYYGRPDIPIGYYKGEPFLTESAYNGPIAREFPNSLAGSPEQPDVVDVYRRALADAPAQSALFIAVGPLPNLKRLLESGPDAHSLLPGQALVQEKVRELVVMGPYFNDEGAFQYAWNFAQDPASAAYVIDHWPTPIAFGEGNLGHRHFIGSALAGTPETNPVRRAYGLAADEGRERHCADPATVLYAVLGARYFGEVTEGRCLVRKEDGATRWDAGSQAAHRYNTQQLPIADLEYVMEKLLAKPPGDALTLNVPPLPGAEGDRP